ncbi:MAG TPA: hypothetical protein VLA43_09495 [Longimicrobiales bacterium]|nr:hypothetical protein [Longimicrobiales bacterium]
MESAIPPIRIRALNQRAVRPDGDFVLYWMVAQRRLGWNFALDRAVEHALELGRPLVILEALRCDYPWASVRHHRFVLDGMRDHAATAGEFPVRYLPYVEPERGAGKGLLASLGKRACVLVTDDAPHFFYPAMLDAAARQVPVLLEAVDSHGLLPLREPQRGFTAAYHFRIHLHKVLLEQVGDRPRAHPLREARDRLPDPAPLSAPDGPLSSVMARWPMASAGLLEGPGIPGTIPVDGGVPPVPFRGGTAAARSRLGSFVEERLAVYHERRNDPDAEAGSRLSPYLHWGHISTHEIFQRVVEREGWTPLRVRAEHRGKRAGWWGMSPEAEAFLDELLTWRELGFNEWVRGGPAVETFQSLPDWARQTLLEHADDERPHRYDFRDFDQARTHDPLWNAAQRELREEGTIHNYLRMLWGKKILEWSSHPREALETMLELNNRYAVDGRDPNSTTGIMWVLGRYDRGWPERAIYGKVRSMSSESTRRKVSVDRYLSRFSGQNTLI